MDTYPPTKQRPALLQLAETLDSRKACLRRDECGDWAIMGSNGHIYAVPEGFQLMVGCDFDDEQWEGARGWNSAKRRLGFASDALGTWACAGFGTVTQDGDDEGSIIIDRLPTQAEAVQIRHVLGIPKARHLSDEQRAASIGRLAAWTYSPETVQGDFIAKSGLHGTSLANPPCYGSNDGAASVLTAEAA
jgi:hypothetical protein